MTPMSMLKSRIFMTRSPLSDTSSYAAACDGKGLPLRRRCTPQSEEDALKHNPITLRGPQNLLELFLIR
jgi:hypothetical protein